MLGILSGGHPVRHGDNAVDLSKTTAADLIAHPPRVVLANFYPFRPGEVVEAHASSTVLLVTACAGSGHLELPDGDRVLDPGCVLVIPWQMPRRYVADRSKPFRLLGVHLAPDEVHTMHSTATTLAHRAEAVSRIPLLPDGDLGLRAAMEVTERSFAESPGPWRDATLAGLGLALAASVTQRLRSQPVQAATPVAPALAALESWMRLAMARPITRADLARRAGLSPSHLAAAFHRAYGCAPLAYLQELRLVEARRRLQSGDASVAEIAAAVGFSDPFWFSRVFRRRWGVPPREMRRL